MHRVEIEQRSYVQRGKRYIGSPSGRYKDHNFWTWEGNWSTNYYGAL